jgi:hypothetical protein
VESHGIFSVVNENIFLGVQQIQGKPHFYQMQEIFDSGKYVISWSFGQAEVKQ